MEARLISGLSGKAARTKQGGGAIKCAKGTNTLIDKKGLRQLWRRYQKAIESKERGAVKAVYHWAWKEWSCQRDTFDGWIRKIKQGRYNLRKTGGLYSRSKRRRVWIWESELRRLQANDKQAKT